MVIMFTDKGMVQIGLRSISSSGPTRTGSTSVAQNATAIKRRSGAFGGRMLTNVAARGRVSASTMHTGAAA